MPLAQVCALGATTVEAGLYSGSCVEDRSGLGPVLSGAGSETAASAGTSSPIKGWSSEALVEVPEGAGPEGVGSPGDTAAGVVLNRRHPRNPVGSSVKMLEPAWPRHS
jgi:hypothetical protein